MSFFLCLRCLQRGERSRDGPHDGALIIRELPVAIPLTFRKQHPEQPEWLLEGGAIATAPSSAHARGSAPSMRSCCVCT